MNSNGISVTLPSLTIRLESTTAGTWTVAIETASPAAGVHLAALPDGVVTMLERHKGWDKASRTYDIADVFMAKGWVPSVPAQGKGRSTYVLWSYNGAAHSAALYQDSQSLGARSKKMREVLVLVPGAVKRSADVVVSYRKDFEAAEKAIELVTRWADDDVLPGAGE